jgi:hypothetical protein
VARPVTACIVSASGQNAFFGELLDALAREFERAGVAVERAVDHFPLPRDELAYLFVPHEFYPLTEAPVHPTFQQLQRTVALTTEQPGTHWFEEVAERAAPCAARFDVQGLGAHQLNLRGLQTGVIPLGYVEDWDRWGGDDERDRPIDVAFLGAHTHRRAEILARCGSVLSEWRTRIHLTESHLPHTATGNGFLAGEEKWELLSRTKILLNLHQGDLPYFEWLRIAEALSNGAVVLTERSQGFEPLELQHHFYAAEQWNLPDILQLLLEDQERIAAARRTAYDFARANLPLRRAIDTLLPALEAAAVSAPAARYTQSALPAPAPLRLPPPQTEPERVARDRGPDDIVRMALKQVLTEQRALRHMFSTADVAGPAADTITTHGPYEATAPHVSVVLTLYDYEHVIGDCIESVARSDHDSCELVLVDDHSTDGSLAAAHAALERTPWLAAKVVARGANGGLSTARNVGLEHCRGDLVFILDADNTIYPNALRRLSEALDADPEATFAYGIVEQFDHLGPRSLTSWRAWSQARFAYGNYIDAMALIRRDALLAAGGYTTDPRFALGWEDYALWCALAERGHRGVLVPEIVARYRVGLKSMLTVTNIDSTDMYAALVELYPRTMSGFAELSDVEGASTAA